MVINRSEKKVGKEAEALDKSSEEIGGNAKVQRDRMREVLEPAERKVSHN